MKSKTDCAFMRENLPGHASSEQEHIGRKPSRVKGIFYSPQTVKVLFVTLVGVLVWSGLMVSRLSTEYSLRQFFPTNHPLLVQDQEIRRTFRLNEKSPFLFVVTLDKGQTWLQKNQIKKLTEVSKKIQEREDVSQILSLPLVEGASQTKNELLIGNVFDRTPSTKWKETILANPLLFPLMVTKDFKSTLIAVESQATTTKDLHQFHDHIESVIQKKFPNAHVLSAGVPLIQSRLSEMIRSELVVFLSIVILVFCGIFYFLFSHWTAIASALVTLLASNLFSLAVLGALKVPMNVVLVTLPIISSVSVMSLLIHTLHLWSQKEASRSQKFAERWAGALDTLKELWLPNFLGAWTTALGFLALAPSQIPLIRQYGWVVALVVGLLSVFGQILVLVSLPFVQPKMRKWFDRPAMWSLIPFHHPRKVLFSIVAVSVVGAILSFQLSFSSRLFDDLPQGDGVRASTEWIDQVFGGVVPYEVVLDSKKENFWKDPVNLQKVNDVASHIRRHPGVGSVVTVSDFFQGGIPAKKEPVAEIFFMFSMAEKNPLSSILTEKADRLRLMIRLKDEPSHKMSETRAWVQKSLHTVFPQVQVAEGGMATFSHAINQEVSKALVFGFWEPLVLIGFFLIFMFRSLRWAVLACLPNLIPPAVLMASLVLSEVSVKPGIALVFSIALGFAFNNTVYLLSRLKALMKVQKTSFLPLKRALLMEANPCFFESFVMFAGFSIFLLSSFSMNRTFGAFMMISIIAGFLADLFFLPAVLRMFPGLLSSRRPTTKSKPNPPVDINRDQEQEEEEEMDMTRVAASFAVFAVLFMAGQPAQAQTAQDILKKSRTQLDSRDDQAKVEMTIIEKNGEKKVRVIEMKTLRDDGFSVLAKIQSPADIKGMGFLGQVNDGKEAQWIYLPSSGQVRRVVTGQTKGGLLGSELSPEDLNSQAIRSSSVKVGKADAESWWIELYPKKGSSTYSKVVTKISKSDFLPQVTEYYVGKRLKKTVEFKNYTKVGSIWRAQLIDVRNHLNGRGTQVKLSDMKLNAGLKSRDFSQSALKED